MKKLYIETYGCQMNVADSEVVVAILQKQDYEVTENLKEAELILVNTCSIRDNAEQRVNKRIKEFARLKKTNKNLLVGVIGCMAERLKEKLLEEKDAVDLVVGPDAYRELPALLKEVESGQQGINTILSLEETYADVSPVRLDKNHVSSFVSIMRGCNNFCSYCVVPYTRGRERSRDPETIVREAKELFEAGYKEVTLLGQNVNSYSWIVNASNEETSKENSSDQYTEKAIELNKGERTKQNQKEAIEQNKGERTKQNQVAIRFEDLLEKVAQISPQLRVRFSTPHPKDMSDELLKIISRYPNLCKSIHLPVQSGSSSTLKRMKRGYDRKMYENRVSAIRKYLPEATISTDIITGFCGETEEEHQETLDLIKWVGYDLAFMFKYSVRPGTLAAKKYEDDVPEEVKTRRLNEIIELQRTLSFENKKEDIGKTYEVLIEGTSKKSKKELFGRTSQNKVVVFPAENHHPGDYVTVTITECTSGTLIGVLVDKA